MNSVYNEHPSRRITDTFIERAVADAFNSFQVTTVQVPHLRYSDGYKSYSDLILSPICMLRLAIIVVGSAGSTAEKYPSLVHDGRVFGLTCY